MVRFDEDIRHELKMIARGQSMVTRGQLIIAKAQECLASIANAMASEGVERAAQPVEMSDALKAECEAARERVRKVVRAPGYVPKYR